MTVAARKLPSTGPHVFFDQGFDDFWARRTAVNQSINALVFSRRLTMHAISTMDPPRRNGRLGALYPAEVVGRFGYQVRTAEAYLQDSAEFLFQAAFISCQPAYEEYVDRVAELVSQLTGVNAPNPRASLVKKHGWFKARGLDMAGPWLEVFEVLREARNAFVHNGGLVNESLAVQRTDLSASAQTCWTRASTGEIPPMVIGDRLDVEALDPVATIYAIGRLAIELNVRLVRSGVVPDLERWADIAVLDYRKRNSNGWKVDKDARRRRAQGHAQFAFGAAIPAFMSKPSLMTDAADRAPTALRLP